MYVENASLNFCQAFTNSTQSTTTAHANHNAFITTNQVAATSLTNYNVIAYPTWYIDSRAINHVNQGASIFLSCFIYISVEKLHIRNGLGLHIKHVRIAAIKTLNSIDIYLTNVLHVPAIIKKLFNVSRSLTDNNAIIEFQKFVYFVKDKSTCIDCILL